MAEFALYRNNVFVEVRVLRTQPDDLPLKGVKWYPVERQAKPTIDEATQVAEPATTLSNGVVTMGWTVRNKTQEETDATKTQQAGIIPHATFMLLFNHENRVRALESKAPITAAQFRAAIKDRL